MGSMSTQYECLKSAMIYAQNYGVTPPENLLGAEVWPRQSGFFIHQSPSQDLALAQGQFGLVPHWVKSASDAKLRASKLAVTRYETMSTATPTRAAWLKGQRCILPMQAFLEDDWRSGKAVPTRIARVDGKPMAVAGLWEYWSKEGETITSYTLLTVNANSHALMNRYGHHGHEKRMPAILNEGAWGAWLSAPLEKAREFMRAYPAQELLANPVQKK
jgi:putative SOS response-associated peptidase YedK